MAIPPLVIAGGAAGISMLATWWAERSIKESAGAIRVATDRLSAKNQEFSGARAEQRSYYERRHLNIQGELDQLRISHPGIEAGEQETWLLESLRPLVVRPPFMPQPQLMDPELNSRMSAYGRLFSQSISNPSAVGGRTTQNLAGAMVAAELAVLGFKSVSKAREFGAQAVEYIKYLELSLESYDLRFRSDLEEDQKNSSLATELCRSLRVRTESSDFKAADLQSLMYVLQHVAGMFEGMAKRYAD